MPRPLRPATTRRLSTQAPLWKCPLCCARFVTRNMPHSCGRYRLADLPQKTRIVFTTRMRFAAVMPRTAWLEGHLNLARRIDDPRFFKIVQYGPATYTHSYRARDASFFDASFAALVLESFAAAKNTNDPLSRVDAPNAA